MTIAPIGKGVNPDHPGEKWRTGSRYFPYYTDPWIDEKDFRAAKHRHITHQQARAIDSAIDQYNTTITDAVRHARGEGRDWYVLDLCGLLDSLAYRRFEDDPEAADRNDWVPYVLPGPIADLDTRFFRSNENGRRQGGLFGLDGIHPTIVRLRHRRPGGDRRPRRRRRTRRADRLRGLARGRHVELGSARAGRRRVRPDRTVRDPVPVSRVARA